MVRLKKEIKIKQNFRLFLDINKSVLKDIK